MSLEIAPRSHAEPFGDFAGVHVVGVKQGAKHHPFGDGDTVGFHLEFEGMRNVIRHESQPKSDVGVQRTWRRWFHNGHRCNS